MLRKPLLKVLACVMIAAMLICSLPVYISASEFTATGTTPDGFEYGIVMDNQATITGYSGPFVKDLVIPTVVNGYRVTVIGNGAFRDAPIVGELVIPEGIWIIEDFAFDGCNEITSLYIPESVYAMRTHSFHNCTGIKSIVVESSNDSFDSRDNCNAIIRTYPNELILGCDNTVIPDTVTTIEDFAFANCKHMETIVIPDSVTRIGTSAFNECYSLKSIEIPESVTYINPYTFNGCTNLESVILPVNINFAWHSFEHCYNLRDIYYRGTEAEWFNIIIPEYNECLLNAKVHYNYVGPLVTEGVIYEVDEITKTATVIGCVDSVKDVYILEVYDGYTVTSIGESAFCKCSALESITIPDTVTKIGENAFEGCTSLKAVEIPDGVTDISYAAFYGCSGLESITIPDSVTSIGKWAFASCTNLKTITIPEGIHTIEYSTFFNCTSLENITLPNSITSIGNSAFSACKALKSINIPDSVTSIGNNAFSQCESLEYITIPDSVTSIGNMAFEFCKKLSSVNLPENLTNIGYWFFYSCSSLKSYTLPNNVVSIDREAFANCSYLENITIPVSVTSIGDGAFRSCKSLSDVYFNGTAAQWNAISIGGDNSPLLNSTIHFTDEEITATTEATEPTESVVDSEPETEATTDEVEPSESVTAAATEPTEESAVVTEATKAYYTVVFVDYDGKLVNAQTVNHGEGAVAPENPVRTGYTFTGWDTDFDVVKSDLTVKAQYTRNSIPVSKVTTGPLKVEVVGGTGFYISLDGGTARPQGATYVNSKLTIGTKVTLTAFSSADSEFMGWVNPETGTVLSTSEIYSFVSTGNDYVKATYKSDIEGINLVAYKNGKAANGNGQILDMQYYSAGDEIAVPDAPSGAGYNFAGWDKTVEEIQSELEASRDVTVLANWEINKEYVTVTVNGGLVNGAASASVLEYANITVISNTPENGKKFAYWTDAAGNVVSYNAEYSFYPSEDTVLSAVFVAEDAYIDRQPIISLSADQSTEGEKITYFLSWDIDESIGTVTNAGLMIVNKNDYNADTFYHNSGDVNIFDRALGSAQISQSNSYAIIKSDSKYDNTYCACTWVQYTDAATAETITVYSDIAEVTKFA